MTVFLLWQFFLLMAIFFSLLASFYLFPVSYMQESHISYSKNLLYSGIYILYSASILYNLKQVSNRLIYSTVFTVL